MKKKNLEDYVIVKAPVGSIIIAPQNIKSVLFEMFEAGFKDALTGAVLFPNNKDRHGNKAFLKCHNKIRRSYKRKRPK